MHLPKTLIFVGAHPDDETFSVGATLAHYALMGVNVYYVCATKGEVGQANPKNMRGFSTVSELRCAELRCATQILGIKDVIFLGFRDSGMQGWEENRHPQALASVPMEKVVESIVNVLRKLRPDVVITYDPIGGYFHPDHIAIHKATVKAFYASADAKQFTEAGSPFKPKKLYFHFFPRRVLRIMAKFAHISKIDLKKIGDKKNIDFQGMIDAKFPIHAVIRPSKMAFKARAKAALCHESMLNGNTPYQGLNGLAIKLFGQNDYYMREYPSVKNSIKEHDLFEGID